MNNEHLKHGVVAHTLLSSLAQFLSSSMSDNWSMSPTRKSSGVAFLNASYNSSK